MFDIHFYEKFEKKKRKKRFSGDRVVIFVLCLSIILGIKYKNNKKNRNIKKGTHIYKKLLFFKINFVACM